MHVLGIVGSMRKHKNTDRLVQQVIESMRAKDTTVTAETIYIADKNIQPCRVICSQYCSTHPYQCCVDDDVVPILEQMQHADAIILGTPLYFRTPPAKFHTFIERLISIFFYQEMDDTAQPSPLMEKPCGLIAVAEYSNPQSILEYLHDTCLVLKLRPALLTGHPYLGVVGQGNLREDTVFHPFERADDLATVLLEGM